MRRPERPGALVARLTALLIVIASPLAAQEFWEQPYSLWRSDDCQQLISRAVVRPYPWKRDLGRSGFYSKGVIVWYSETVWKAFFKTKNVQEEDLAKKAAECRPSLLLAVYFKDDPGYDTAAYRASYSPAALLSSTRLDNMSGAVVYPSPQPPSCKPFVDKYTIVFNFPVTPALANFLARSETVMFECGGLGIAQTFDLNEMRVGGVRDAHWRLGQPVPVQPTKRRVIDPLPFKVFPLGEGAR